MANHHKPDGFFSEARKILHKSPIQTIRISVSTGALVKNRADRPTIETFKCISCFASHNVFERNIRGRILRGYMVVEDDKTIIKHHPPGKPCYHNGRLCEACFPKYSVQATNPTDYQSIQLLKDFEVPQKRDVITQRKIELEEKEQEDALEQAKKDARPHLDGIAIEVGSNTSKEKRRWICSNTNPEIRCTGHNGEQTLRCSACGSEVIEELLKPDPNAFRAFMKSRSGGRNTGGRKQFDPDINFSNLKKG